MHKTTRKTLFAALALGLTFSAGNAQALELPLVGGLLGGGGGGDLLGGVLGGGGLLGGGGGAPGLDVVGGLVGTVGATTGALSGTVGNTVGVAGSVVMPTLLTAKNGTINTVVAPALGNTGLTAGTYVAQVGQIGAASSNLIVGAYDAAMITKNDSFALIENNVPGGAAALGVVKAVGAPILGGLVEPTLHGYPNAVVQPAANALGTAAATTGLVSGALIQTANASAGAVVLPLKDALVADILVAVGDAKIGQAGGVLGNIGSNLGGLSF